MNAEKQKVGVGSHLSGLNGSTQPCHFTLNPGFDFAQLEFLNAGFISYPA